MLTLTVKAGDDFTIGDNIRVVFLRSKSMNQVKIGIDAPRDIPILRRKLIDRAEAAAKAAEILEPVAA